VAWEGNGTIARLSHPPKAADRRRKGETLAAVVPKEGRESERAGDDDDGAEARVMRKRM